jgi:hypothetical protein
MMFKGLKEALAFQPEGHPVIYITNVIKNTNTNTIESLHVRLRKIVKTRVI